MTLLQTPKPHQSVPTLFRRRFGSTLPNLYPKISVQKGFLWANGGSNSRSTYSVVCFTEQGAGICTM